jgi:WD40 repeat protein
MMAEHPEHLLRAAFSPDGATLVSVGEKGTVMVWDAQTYQSLSQPLVGYDGWLINAAFSSMGPEKSGESMLALSNITGITLWDATEGQSSGFLPDSGAVGFWALAFTPDGQMLASGDKAGNVRLWRIATQQPVRQPFVGHTEQVRDVAFSSDGLVLASGGNDHAVILWDIATHRPLGDRFINNGEVWQVTFSPDNRLLAAGDTSGTVSLWDINPDRWQAYACDIADRNLTLAEWERYLGYEPYRLICPHAPPPPEEIEATALISTSRDAATPTSDLSTASSGAKIVETFESDQGFIQTSPNVQIVDGQVHWHIKRSDDQQYVYRNIPPFSGNVRLTVRGQVDSWTNNCIVQVGIGEKPGSGLRVNLGWIGGGCETHGPLIDASGVALNRYEKEACQYTGNWLWIDSQTPYTTTLTVIDGSATLAVDGIGSSAGTVKYNGPYTTLSVGNTGRGDWPECTGTIDMVIVEPLD